MRVRAAALSALVAASGIAGGPLERAREDAKPPLRGEIRVLAVHPHDPFAFTQGLLWHAGRLYESLGGYGTSEVREVELVSGSVLRAAPLPRSEFGEGLAIADGRLIQLTWREGVARYWRLADLSADGAGRFEGEGWGLTYDGRHLVQSDGTSQLTFRAPSDLQPIRTLRVFRSGRPESYLNELEWAAGTLYANIWQSDEIVRIDAASGRVVAVFDASALLAPEERAGADVLNGIAWNADNGRFYLTGKQWPKLFEVELVEPAL